MFCCLYLLGLLLKCNARLTLNPERLWLQKDSTACLLWMYKAVLRTLRMKKLRVRGGGCLDPSHRTKRCQSMDANPARSDFLA